MATVTTAATAREERWAGSWRSWQRILIAVLGVAFVTIRVWNLTTFCLDSDEIFSLLSARFGIGGLLHAVRVDVVHPPLSYLVLWIWIRIGGESLLWMRLLPFTLSIASLVPIGIIFRQLRLNAGAIIIALFLLTISDYQVFHARYVRMYALLFLLSLVSVAIFNAYLKGVTGKRAILLSAVNLLLVYTHYYGWMVVAVEGLYLLIFERAKLKPFFLGSVCIALLFAPWAIAAADAAAAKGGLTSNLGWIRHPKIGDLWWYYAGCDGPLWPIPVASAIVFLLFGATAAGLWRVFRAEKNPVQLTRLRFTLMLAVIPPVVTYLISNMMRNSVWGNRHLIVSTVPYLCLLGSALIELRPRSVRLFFLSVVAIWGMWGAYRVTLQPDPRNNMDVLTGQLVELNSRLGSPSSRALYLLDPYLSFPMRYFLESHYHQPWQLIDAPSPSAIPADRAWVAYNHKTWRGSKTPQELFRNLGYRIGPGIWAADRWDRIAIFLIYKPESGLNF
ncbi:MAG: hypothetical protein U0Q18_05000 [Bryobacteraceae bacterium]